jgi:YggT family protein
MSGGYLTNPLIFVVQTFAGLYALVVMLRFLLQLTGADFYNPVSQFVVKVTTPVLHPLRRIVPSARGLDLSSLVLAWLVKTGELAVVGLLSGLGVKALGAPFWAVPALAALTINIFLFAILIRVVLSWINPDPYHPIGSLLESLTQPVMRPAQRLIPPVGGLDLSPILAMVGLVLLEMLLLPPLKAITGSPF